MFYVPYDNKNDYACYTLYDSNTIRAYKQTPQVSANNEYTDFYLNSHYISKMGYQYIESTQELPLCISNENITNDYWYRLDLAHIIVVVSFFLMFLFFTFKVFARLFGRWLKV